MASGNVNVGININAGNAKAQLESLQKQLQSISNMKLNLNIGDSVSKELNEASQAAMELQAHLSAALNPQTGNLDFTKFNSSIQKSGKSLESYADALQNMGPAGQKAFVSLADSISKAEIPLKRTNKMIDDMWDGLKRTAGWQLQSSIVHGVVGSVQQAVGYAKDLNRSLNDIRIVTGASSEQMADFAIEANKAAKSLSTTTTEYTKASLIYYQQGLGDAEVKRRTDATIKMANVTGQSAQTISEQMTSVWNNFDNGTKSLEYYGDVMASLGAKTASSTDEIAEGLQKFSSVADAIGLSYEYATSAVTTITATTRESASSVGTALRTLFSRLQGLQLGETLDDGTTLNKYSQALMTAGINIKDTSGELKNMDTILDELGGKWESLGKDEQVALAQTVAGVRQYTQLVALMDNWDFFQENVMTAKSAGGTLDQQAAIYAESWEAASQRVRASWEGLWDNLINDDGFIAVLDFMSGMVDGLSSITSGLGGAKGMLLGFGGILTKVFAPNIVKSVSDVAYNVGMMLPGARQRAEQQAIDSREKLINKFTSTLSDENGNIMSSASGDSEAFLLKSQLDNIAHLDERRSKMTDIEIEIDKSLELQQKELATSIRDNNQRADAAERQRKNLMTSKNAQNALNEDYDLTTSAERLSGKGAWKGKTNLKKIQDELDIYNNLESLNTRQQNRVNQLQSMRDSILEKSPFLQADFERYENKTSGISREQAIKDQVEKNSKFEDAINSILGDNFNAADEAVQNKIIKAYEDFDPKRGKEWAQLYLSEMNADGALTEGDKGEYLRMWAQDSMDNAMRVKTGASQEAQRYAQYYTEEYRSRKQSGEYEGLYKDRQDQRDKLGTKGINYAEVGVEAASGIMEVAGALESLKSISSDQGLVSNLTSLVSVIGQLAMSSQSFGGILTTLGMTASKAGIWGLAISGGLMAIMHGLEQITLRVEEYQNHFQTQARNASRSAEEMTQAYESNKQNHQQLLNTVAEYRQAETELNKLTSSSKERIEAELEYNNLAFSLIGQYNLEGNDYRTVGTQVKISDSALQRIEETSSRNVEESRIASSVANVRANEIKNESQRETMNREMGASLDNLDGNQINDIVGSSLKGIVAGVGLSLVTTAAIAAAPVVAPAALLAGGLAGLGATAAAATLAENLTNNIANEFANKNLADRALQLSKLNGTSWMSDMESDIMKENFSESEAKIIYSYRNSLQELSSSMQAAAAQGDIVAQNAAKMAISSNSAAEYSEESAKIQSGASKIWRESYDTQERELQGMMKSRNFDEKKLQAETVAEELGIANLNNFSWDEDDRKNGRMTYTYLGDNGEVLEGAISYDSIIAAQAAKTANMSTDEYINDILPLYDKLESSFGENGAGGLFSLFTNGDFEDATVKEIAAAQEAFQSLIEMSNENFQDIFGSSKEDFAQSFGFDNWTQLYLQGRQVGAPGETNQLKSNIVTNMEQMLGEGGQYEGLLDEGIFNNLTQGTIQQLYGNLTEIAGAGGQEAGEAYLRGLNLLTETGMSEGNITEAMNRLMQIDWSAWDAGDQAAVIINSLGGSLQSCTGAWEAFTAAMRNASNAIPDFSAILGQLTSLLGQLKGLESGGGLSEDLVNYFKDNELEHLMARNYDGSYTFIGENTDEVKKGMQDEVIAASQEMQKRKEIADDYFGEDVDGDGTRDTEGPLNAGEMGKLTSEQAITALDAVIAGTASDVQAVMTEYLEAATGKTASKMQADFQETEKAANAVDTASDGSTTDGFVRNPDGTWTKTTSDFWGNETTETASTSQAAAYEQAYQDAMIEYEAKKEITDSYIDAARGTATADYSEVQEESAESFISTFDNAAEAIQAIQSGEYEGLLSNEDGTAIEGALQGLLAVPATSERATAAIQEYVQAERELAEIDQEIANINQQEEDNEISESQAAELREEAEARREIAEAATEEAAFNAELASTIDSVAAARGLDAEAVATQVELMLMSGQYEGMSSSSLADMAADMVEINNTVDEFADSWQKINAALSNSSANIEDNSSELKSLGKFLAGVTNNTKYLATSMDVLNKAFKNFKKNEGDVEKFFKGVANEVDKMEREVYQAGKSYQQVVKRMAKETNQSEDAVSSNFDTIAKEADDIKDKLDPAWAESGGIITPEAFGGGEEGQKLVQQAFDTWEKAFESAGGSFEDFNSAESQMARQHADTITGMELDFATVETQDEATAQTPKGWETISEGPHEGEYELGNLGTDTSSASGSGSYQYPILKQQGNSNSGGGGGGGGGGAKEPKKVANKRKSQTVKRYKKVDYRRKTAESSTKSEENKKDLLYGESKIAQMEKLNKLAEKEAHITADRIRESRNYLVEDRQNLIKYLQKYGYEAEFDADGFLSNYEETWTKIHEEIAALYEDNLLTEDEEKIEEDLNIKLEELEGALEDYENSLDELYSDIEAYEESLFDMYDNYIEGVQHKVELGIELDEDDLEYLDFYIEAIGDSVNRAIDSIEAMGNKANALFNGLNTYKQGIDEILALSDDPLQVWATGGIEGILTEKQVDALRENRDGLADYMQQLIDLREEIKDKTLDTFDAWQEKIESTLSTIEACSSVLEHFKSMIDVVGTDPLGITDRFVNDLETSVINQSMNTIEATRSHYENLIEVQQEAENKLADARARGDESSAEHWEEVVRETTSAMEEAQESMLTALEDTLNLIAEQFESQLERIAQTFNDTIYNAGGLEGLSNDYSLIRENADLMAEDYQKIYDLSKLTRNINKTLDDTNIIAGKQKMTALLKEVNALQASGVELSKYDLEYLQAKYELRLAEIELENAQNSKSTVRLQKDDEGNWSYIYTQNRDNIEEAEQKYEDALYEMQTMSNEYLEEMSSMMLDTSSAMMEEISALRIQDFTSYEAYQNRIKQIQDKYADSLRLQEDELNKAVSNNSSLYEQDWQDYNRLTGYKISMAEDWVDTFRESTLGTLLDSETIMSNFSDTFLGISDQMSASLAAAAIQYFENIDTAFNKYGTSIQDFGGTVTSTIENISSKSEQATEDTKTMAEGMSEAFKEIADTVSNWQAEFSLEIDNMLEKISKLIQSINDAIEESAKIEPSNRDSYNLIGSAEAIDLLNALGTHGSWTYDKSSGLKLNGNATTFVDYNGELIEKIDDKMEQYFNAQTGSDERNQLGEELKEMFKIYWEYRDIINRVYDITDLPSPKYSSFDTGGYTGEWGTTGKLAMLHQKEIVLNATDTANFLEALNVSRSLIEMIEMNARQSSMGLGDMVATAVQDTSQVIEQQVSITAEFPDATDHTEIEEAFTNLINTASQYANRYRT